jgi:hypothetical protein
MQVLNRHRKNLPLYLGLLALAGYIALAAVGFIWVSADMNRL